MNISSVRDVSRTIVGLGHNTQVTPTGLFRFIDWGAKEKGEKAYKAAQNFFNDLKDGGKDIGEDEWKKYFDYAQNVYENKNTGITAGLGVMLQAAAGLVTLSTNLIQVASTQSVFGGPASLTSNNKSFLGVGNGLTYCTLTGSATAGSTSILSVSAITGGTIAAGDIIILQDSTTLQAQGTNVEFATVSAFSSGSITLTAPVRYGHASATYVTRVAAPSATDMIGGSKTYKGIDTGFPTYTTPSSKATLTWQSTYATSEAQYAWNECLIGAVPNGSSAPNAGSGSTGVTTIPSSSVLLAASVWYPSPLTKAASVISQQYQFQVQ